MEQKCLFGFVLSVMLVLCTIVSGQYPNTEKNPSSIQIRIPESGGEEAEARDVKFSSELDSCHILNAVALKTGASREDMKLFSNFYTDTIYNDRMEFFSELRKAINSNTDVQQYASAKISNYIVLYEKLQQIKKDYPGSFGEYSTQHSIPPVACMNANCSSIGFESGNLTVGIKTFDMYIFDRWGMQLYHTNNIVNGWNGTVNNGSTICQEDTYVYMINITDVRGQVHKYMGRVSIIK